MLLILGLAAVAGLAILLTIVPVTIISLGSLSIGSIFLGAVVVGLITIILFFCASTFLSILLGVGALAGGIYLFLTWNYSYWKNLGVPGPEPKIPVGTYTNMLSRKRHMAEDIDEVYRMYKKDYDFVGIYSSRSPQLLILNPQLMKRIFITDFKHFHDNEASLMSDKENDPILARNPFLLAGDEWKEVRLEITPGLLATRIKAGYPITKLVCKRLTHYIHQQMRKNPANGIDGKDMCLRYTSEIVTDCVLGLKSDSFAVESPPIVKNISKLFQQSFTLLLYLAVTSFLPILRRVYKLRFIPKDVEQFFLALIQKAGEMRKSQLAAKDPNIIGRIDYMNYLMELEKKKGYKYEELTAHTMTFLLDGYETTAGVLAHTLYFLGLHPDKQEKLRQEIEEHLVDNGQIEFEKLDHLPFLDACIHECIRVYPPGVQFNKLCTQSIELVNRNNKKLLLKEGSVVIIPAYSVMHDEDIYEDPFEFKPERFLGKEDGMKKYRDMGAYYGFGEGPRICLGIRFALTQIKAALIEVVSEFDVTVNSKTSKGFCLDPMFLVSQKKGGIWLDFKKRN